MKRRFRFWTRAAVLCVVVAAGLLSLPGQQTASSALLTTFVGDFEVGAPGWQQFNSLQYEEDRPIGDSFALVESPIRQGRRAVRITSHHGYSRFGHNESTQLYWNGGEQEGQQYWYAWSTLFPRDWRAPHKWGIFAEWHANLSTTPLISFNARNDFAELTLFTGLADESNNDAAVDRVVPLLPTLSKGRWNDFVMNVRWTQLNDGFVDVYHRVQGAPLRKLASIRNVPTFQITKSGKGLGAYLLLGMYRASYCPQPTQVGCTGSLGTQQPSTVFHDGFVRERTFEAAVRKAFPGVPPTLPPASARAVQQEGMKFSPGAPTAARSSGVQAEKACKRCRVVSKDGRTVARIAGAEDDRDTAVLAYTLRQRSAVVIQDKLSVVASRLTGPLVVAQIRNARDEPLVELYVGTGGTLRLASPRGALRSSGFDVDTGIAATPGADPRPVELRLTSDGVWFAVSGRLVVRFTGLAGPARGQRVDIRVGIERYEGRRGTGGVSVVHQEAVVGRS